MHAFWQACFYCTDWFTAVSSHWVFGSGLWLAQFWACHSSSWYVSFPPFIILPWCFLSHSYLTTLLIFQPLIGQVTPVAADAVPTLSDFAVASSSVPTQKYKLLSTWMIAGSANSNQISVQELYTIKLEPAASEDLEDHQHTSSCQQGQQGQQNYKLTDLPFPPGESQTMVKRIYALSLSDPFASSSHPNLATAVKENWDWIWPELADHHNDPAIDAAVCQVLFQIGTDILSRFALVCVIAEVWLERPVSRSLAIYGTSLPLLQITFLCQGTFMLIWMLRYELLLTNIRSIEAAGCIWVSDGSQSVCFPSRPYHYHMGNPLED